MFVFSFVQPALAKAGKKDCEQCFFFLGYGPGSPVSESCAGGVVVLFKYGNKSILYFNTSLLGMGSPASRTLKLIYMYVK